MFVFAVVIAVVPVAISIVAVESRLNAKTAINIMYRIYNQDNLIEIRN